MIHGVGSYNPERHSSILLERIQEEQRLLRNPRRTIDDAALYITDRIGLLEPVSDEIKNRLRKDQSARILEIGAGEGYIQLSLAEVFSTDERFKATMTSLSPMKEHEEVRSAGVKVYTGVLSERLPNHWTESFDIVCTDSVIGWTDVPKSLSEIRRVLAVNGVWMGLESADVSNADNSGTVKSDIEAAMKDLKMRNSESWWNKLYWWLEDESTYRIKYKKTKSLS